MGMFELLVSLSVIALTSFLWELFKNLVWRPYALTKSFKKQGISGPPYTFISGSLEEIKTLNKLAKETILDKNSQDIIPRILPHYYKWFSLYGDMFIHWFGSQPRLVISDPELAKEVLSNKFGFYAKIKVRPSAVAILGWGLVTVEGSEWARHRRLLNPAFNMDKIKVRCKHSLSISIVNRFLNGLVIHR